MRRGKGFLFLAYFFPLSSSKTQTQMEKIGNVEQVQKTTPRHEGESDVENYVWIIYVPFMRCSCCYEKNVKNLLTAPIADNSLALGTIKMKISSFYESLNIMLKISRAIPAGMDVESFQI